MRGFGILVKGFFFALAVCVAGAGSVMAYKPPGLAEGAQMPPVSLVDQNGQIQDIESLYGERGIVLFFVRSADWCPFCKVQLIDLQNRAEDIVNAGYSVASVSYDSAETLKKFTDRYKIDYLMLSDPESEAIKAFGILNETVDPESDWYGIPHPVIYVINTKGVIQARLAEENYRDRPRIDAVLLEIDALNQ